MNWRYYRNSKFKVSKWVRGLNWVTKFDAEGYCHFGLHGIPQGTSNELPAEIRKFIDSGKSLHEYQKLLQHKDK